MEHANEEVLVERRGHVMLITLNRPKARNAVNVKVHMGLGLALEDAEADPEIRCVILTGAGDKAFCAGADLVALSRGESLRPEDPAHAAWGFAGFVSHPIGKPIIAAVNGFALGGGSELALASDIVIAADTAAFGLPEVKRGIFAAAGGVFRLGQQIPKKIAMEMMLTGDPISAERALELGLVNRVVPFDGLLDAAFEMAEKIAANAPLSVQASKRIAMGMDGNAVPADAELWERSTREGAKVFASLDTKEGPKAFAEKRAPVWQAK